MGKLKKHLLGASFLPAELVKIYSPFCGLLIKISKNVRR